MSNNILITGGTGKIGAQLVNHFLVEGWRVVYTTRSHDSRDRLAERFGWKEEIRDALRDVRVDFNDPAATTKLLDELQGESIHVVVNNARDLSSLKIREDGLSERQHLQQEYLIDVIVPYELSTGLIASGHPLRHIINVSSIYGSVPFNPALYDNYEQSAPIQYSLAKAAVNHLTRELAIRYRKTCQVNTISYGGVVGRVSPEFLERYAKLCPQGEMLTEEQTVGPVAFLASPASRGITGQNIIQDGGWTCW